MRRLLIPCVTLLFLVFISCDHDDKQEIAFDNNYLPLSVGNYWEFSDLGPSPGPSVISEHREVMGRITLNSYEYFLVVSTRQFVDGPFVDSLFYRIADNGYVYTYRKNYSDEAQDLRLNGLDGDSWTYNYLDEETRVTLTETSVDLSSGPVANCKNYYRDTIQSADEEYTISLAPGIGFVKEYSNAWGLGHILKSARINGVVRTF